MSLRKFIVQRAIQSFILLIAIITFLFILIHTAPGNPIVYMLGPLYSQSVGKALEAQLGLNKPLYVQYILYLKNVFSGNLGYSDVYNEPVLTIISQRVVPTLFLTIPSLVISLILGTFLGIVSSKHALRKTDYSLTVAATVGFAIPGFWSGSILVLIFAVRLGWLPSMGMTAPGASLDFFGLASHLILPTIVLSGYSTATYFLLTRSSMMEALTKDFIISARARGLSSNAIYFKHAFRNALLPILTTTGYFLGLVITGVVLTETIFVYPGLGSLIFTAITERDYPVVMGVFLLVSLSVIIANFCTDVAYSIVDPRISRT